jgi:hypothetical protein
VSCCDCLLHDVVVEVATSRSQHHAGAAAPGLRRAVLQRVGRERGGHAGKKEALSRCSQGRQVQVSCDHFEGNKLYKLSRVGRPV